MTSLQLKMIALLLMILDHIGASVPVSRIRALVPGKGAWAPVFPTVCLPCQPGDPAYP